MEPILYTPIQLFFDQTIIVNQFVYLDFWSILHFISGLLLGWLVPKFIKNYNHFLVAFLLITTYEVIELGLNGILFIAETPLDIAWDLIIGTVGFMLTYLISQKKKSTV